MTAAVGWMLSVLGAGACDTEIDCFDGEFISCLCGDERGFQQCAAGVYGVCVCDGTVPGLTTAETTAATGGQGGEGTGGAGGGGGATLLPFMATCETNEQCETMLCHVFNAKGPKCSKACVDANDCPLPSPGCNMMGICKAP